MSTIILNIVIILGIIIAGGFLVFFLGDLLLSIIDPKSDERKMNRKRDKSIAKFEEKIKDLDKDVVDQVKSDPKIAEILALKSEEEELSKKAGTAVVVEAYQTEEVVDEEKKEEKKEEDDVFGEESAEDRLAAARAALEKRKAEIIKRMQEQAQAETEKISPITEESKEETEEIADVEETAEEPQSIEETIEENEPVVVEEEIETAEETVEESEPVVVEEEAEETELLLESVIEDADELERAREALQAEKDRYTALIASITNGGAKEKVVAHSKQEYEERLLVKSEELDANEKEFRACKREYLPLNKVAKTLEKDEKKLRIKEAQVAKQKVLLYGVNNYADIDEERAKKLAEELDLLDGLKLSVQHCREVIESNKERLPILEKMYNVLRTQNESLKKDIAYLEEVLESIENEERK